MRILQRIIVFFSVLVGLTGFASADPDCLYLKSLFGQVADADFGYSIAAAGDINNNGTPDIIIGAPGTLDPRVYVYDGGNNLLIHTIWGGANNISFGRSVAGAGDVNGDGYADLIIGFPEWSDPVSGVLNVGKANVYSGLTGGVIHSFTGTGHWEYLGTAVAGAGDVNNDGYDDLVVGAPDGDATDPGMAYIFNGLTGDLIYGLTGEAADDEFGMSVSKVGDVNSDGYDDVIIGAGKAAGGIGRAYVYSGQSGNLIYTLTGEAVFDWFGNTVASAGDVNNDGIYDILIGAPFNDGPGEDGGRVYVYNGQTGGLLYSLDGEAAGDQFGNAVASAGDVNHDGYDDLSISAEGNDAGGTDAGRVYVYDGNTGALLNTIDGQPSEGFGSPQAIDGIGDINQDGVLDIAVGAYGAEAFGTSYGKVYIYSIYGDVDSDDFVGNCDNCPTDYNPGQEDTDNDNVGDICDVCPGYDDNINSDNDGLPDGCDNCPNYPNPDQADADGDGNGDVCDACTDIDGDGYGDPGYPNNGCNDDNCPSINNPTQADADGDGIGDDCDECTDTDMDGFGDPGYPANTCPEDNCVAYFNPSQEDNNSNGVGDACEDMDGDGVVDGEDNCINMYNPDQADYDGDGIGDYWRTDEYVRPR
jgi:hypothetical protein